MYLSERLIYHLCKHKVSFSVNYRTEVGAFCSTISSIQIDNGENIVIKALSELDESNYILSVNGEEERIVLLEALLVRLLNLKVLPENAYF